MARKKFPPGAFVAAALALAIAAVGCDTGVSGGAGGIADDGAPGSGVDFESHNANAAIWVSNRSPHRLVAFMGSLRAENILGGIPASTSDHAIRSDPRLFDRTKSFTMVLITEEQFVENRDNLSALNNSPFARVFVMYNHGIDNPHRHEISGRLGGRHRLLVQNPTGRNVELRVGGISGEVVGLVPAGLQTVTLYLTDGDLDIFPVFKSFNPVRNAVTPIHPRMANGEFWFHPFGVGGAAPRLLTLNLREAMEAADYRRTLGAAWVIVRNDSNAAVRVQRGNTVIEDTMGITYINSGEHITILLDMATVGSSSAETITLSNLRVGPSGHTVQVFDQHGGTSFVLGADRVYTVYVTGNFQQDTLGAAINTDNWAAVDFDALEREAQRL